MSSVLFQSLNATGSPALRNELNSLRNQLSDSKKDLALLLKAVEAKSPEVFEEYGRMKAQDAALAAATSAPPSNNQRNAVNSLRR